MKKRADLLDLLHEKTGCEYFSEMKELRWRNKLIQAIRETDASAYPYTEWAAAFAYLFQEDGVRIDSEKAFYAYLENKAVKEGCGVDI